MAAISTEANRPYDTVTVTITSATDWEAFTVPKWCRFVTIQNVSAGVVYLSKDETGTWATGDDQVEIPAGQELTIPITSGQAQALSATARTFYLAAGGGSTVVRAFLTASKEV